MSSAACGPAARIAGARRAPRLMALEPRMMFDGAAVATAPTPDTPDPVPAPEAEAPASESSVDAPAAVAPPSEAPAAPREVAFIDSSVTAADILAAGLRDGVEVVMLDGTRDGLVQMAEWATAHSGYDAIHVLSHGTEGMVQLGSLRLDSAAVTDRAADLAVVGSALNADGDLLLYGCSVAGNQGWAFIDAVAIATGADVAASDDVTGTAAQGGDWVLERQSGLVETAVLEVADYAGVFNAANTTVTVTAHNNPSDVWNTAANVDANVEQQLGWADFVGGTLGQDLDIDPVNNTITIGIYNNVSWSVADFDLIFANTGSGVLDSFTSISRTGGTASNAADYSASVNGKVITINVPNGASGDGTVIFTYVSTSIVTNAAPTLDAGQSPALANLAEDAGVPVGAVGTLVSGLVGGISDTDAGDPKGIAVTAVNETNGTWYYTTDGGTAWTAVGAVSNTSALLLKSDANTRLYFKPSADYNGTVSNGVTFRAWDQTSGTAGNKVTTATNGGSSAFSTATDTIAVTITSVNDAPTNSVAPAITGTATVGSTLTGGNGTWSDVDGDTITYTYQWQRADDNSGTNTAAIAGATASTYTLTSSDAHKYVRLVVTGSDGTASPTANSAWTAVTNLAPSNSAVPTVSGTAAVGNQLTASTGTWSDGDSDTLSYSYQWYRADDGSGTNLAAIAGATASTYTLTSSEAHKYVRVVVTANDGNGSSNQTANSTLGLVANTLPVLGGTFTTAGTVNDNATTTPFANVTVADSDTDNVSIAITFTAANGTLAGTGLTGSNGSYTLTATDAATLQTRLRALEFTPTANQVAPGSTVVTTFTLTPADSTGNGTANATTQVTATSINDAPVINNLQGDAATFSVGGSVVTLDASTALTLTDADTPTTLASATVQITGNYQNGEDVLAFTNDGSTMGGITATWTAGTGTLALTGSATKAQWAAALKAVTYNNTNGSTSSTAQRTVTWTVNDGTADSASVTSTISLVRAPNIDLDGDNSSGATGANFSGSYTENGTAIAIIDTDATLTDDGANLNQAVITITNAQTGDLIQLTGRTTGDVVNGITITYTSNSVITLSGSATKADYLTLLKEAVYSNSSEAPNTTARSITFAGRDTDDNTGPVATATISVTAVNDAPALSGNLSLSAVNEDTASPAGATIATLAAGVYSDPDNGAETINGVAVIGNTANASTEGAWQYSTDGTTWHAVGTVGDDATALALSAATKLRFVPVANYNGTPTALSVRALDASYASGWTNGSTRTTVNTGTTGGTTAIAGTARSVTTSITAVNDVPTLGGTFTTAGTVNDTATTSPFSAVTVADVESDNVALTITFTGANGTLSAAGNPNWLVQNSAGNYTLSATDPTTQTTRLQSLVFTPTANQVAAGSTVATTFTITPADAGSGSANATTVVTATSINDAPTLDNSQSPALTAVDEDAAAPAGAVGTLVSSLVGGVADADTSASKGIAITAVDATNGTWYYTTNGGTTWTEVGTVGGTSALLLASDGNTRLYFKPAADWNGTVTSGVTFRAWDTTAGTAGTKVDASTNGNATAFSTATDTIAVTVNAVNDVPTVTLGSGTTTCSGNTAVTIVPALTLADIDSANLNQAVVTLTASPDNASEALSSTFGTGLKTVNGETLTFTLSPDTHTLTISGTATKATYQEALRSVQYTNSVRSGTDRTARITVRDSSDGTSANADRTIYFNTAPVVTSGTVDGPKGTEGSSYSYSLPTGTFTDAGDTLTYTQTDLPPGLTIDPATGTISGKPTKVGTYLVTITATDSGGLTATKTVRIVVESAPVNNPIIDPVRDPISDPKQGPGDGGTGTDGGGNNNGPAVTVTQQAPTTVVVVSPPPPPPIITSRDTGGQGTTGTLTQPSRPGGFQVVVANRPAGGGDGLMVNRGMNDTVLPATGKVEISIPVDAFAHTNPNAAVQLSAVQVNGQALPNWVAFDPQTGKFTVQAPPGVQGVVTIKVIARDDQGREAVTTFKIVVGGARPGQGEGQGQRSGELVPLDGAVPARHAAGDERVVAPGKPGLMAQMKTASAAGRMAAARTALVKAARAAAQA